MASSVSSPINFDVAIHNIVREERGHLLSQLITILQDINLAEDALQDAVVSALVHWRKNGLPKIPKAWLLTTAKHKAIDRIRRDKNFHTKKDQYQFLLELQNEDEPKESDFDIPDERLRLIFTCCHPSLDDKTSVALTLQLLGGLSINEIAKAFLLKPETMAQRLVRGKAKIRHAAIPYHIPERDVFKERLNAVLTVLYLIFNEGYSATTGKKHIRIELCHEAIRLARILYSLCPREAEVQALLALMLLHDARRTARFNSQGDFIPLEEQDRNLWNKTQIKDGTTLVQNALKAGKIGSYKVQAAISALHSEASSYTETKWPEIVLLYDELYKINPTPVIKLNRLVALSYVKSVKDTLIDLDILESEFKDYQPFYAVKADFLFRSENFIDARSYFLMAIKLSGNLKEREFLKRRLATIPI
ncbi:MAG: RNA polymerase sigma factor [Proteobacteria bacterium]|jgi:RNA polymerase sigma-70 factor, ECF subfamily|nr:RNA polymerase sigma factor [Pseudomonadota bacterium]